MPTCRLSAVITGCGGKEMTCSRRSMVARTRSTNGTSSARPGDRVRLYRPRRSTTFAWAWGTIVTLFARTTITNNAITMRAIRAGSTVLRSSGCCDAAIVQRPEHSGHPPTRGRHPIASSAVADVGDRALDLHDPHLGAHLVCLVVQL